MFITPVGINNQYAFKAKYTNPSGKTVDVSQKAINRAETTAYIRKTVDKAMKECPEKILYNAADDYIVGKRLYFTIDENGKCVISNKEFPEICYKGEIKGSDYSFMQREADEIEAYSVIPKHGCSYSDELGAVRSLGIGGRKYAYILPDGSIEITHPEWAPED